MSVRLLVYRYPFPSIISRKCFRSTSMRVTHGRYSRRSIHDLQKKQQYPYDKDNSRDYSDWRRTYASQNKSTPPQSQQWYLILAVAGALVFWYWWRHLPVTKQQYVEEKAKEKIEAEKQAQIDQWTNSAVSKLEKGLKIDPEPNYIPRPAIEETLRVSIEHIVENLNRVYCVVIGSAGNGKKTCLHEVIRGREATVVVKIDEHTKPSEISFKVLKEVGITQMKMLGGKDPSNFFMDICKKYKITHLDDTPLIYDSEHIHYTLPLVVFDIDPKTHVETLQAVTDWCKWLSSAERLCGAVINLSTDYLAIAMDNESDQWGKYIYVGPFTENQAYQYATTLKPDIEKESLDHIIQKLGTSPKVIKKALKQKNIESYINDKYATAKGKISKIISDEKYLQLLQSLLSAPGNKLTVEDISRIDPSLKTSIANNIRSYHIIEYLPTGHLTFSSPVTQQASREIIESLTQTVTAPE